VVVVEVSRDVNKDLGFKAKARTKDCNFVLKDNQGPRPKTTSLEVSYLCATHFFCGAAAAAAADAEHNDTLVVLNYAGDALVGSYDSVTVNIRRGQCTRQRTCRFTREKQLVNRSDAIVFNDMIQSDQFPSHRPPHQKWVFRTLEVQS